MSSVVAAPAAAADSEETTGSTKIDLELVRWQRRLLPFMAGFVVMMAVAFFCFSGLHLYQVTAFIETEHGQNIRAQIESEIAKPTKEQLTGEAVTQHSLLLLEADALDKRYHEASALLMSRIWSRQLTFITGMVLAFLGAVFILGKLSESTSQISGGASELKVAISSASPGIILSFFGTVLLVSSLFVRASLDVTDGPAYLNVLRRPAYNSNPIPNPPPVADPGRPLTIDEFEKLNQQNSAPADSKK
jgi:hypothetical protein